MGEIKSQDYYEWAFKTNPEFSKPYKECQYFPIWDKAIAFINTNDIIIDAGCGVGQVAQMIFDKGYSNHYFGFDSCEYAIKKCVERNLFPMRFAIAKFQDIDIADISQFFNIKVIAFEFLEHVDDFKFIEGIGRGTTLIFSVPDFDEASHLRHFKTKEEVIERYSDYLEIEYIEKFNRWYLVKSFVK